MVTEYKPEVTKHFLGNKEEYTDKMSGNKIHKEGTTRMECFLRIFWYAFKLGIYFGSRTHYAEKSTNTSIMKSIRCSLFCSLVCQVQ